MQRKEWTSVLWSVAGLLMTGRSISRPTSSSSLKPSMSGIWTSLITKSNLFLFSRSNFSAMIAWLVVVTKNHNPFKRKNSIPQPKYYKEIKNHFYQTKWELNHNRIEKLGVAWNRGNLHAAIKSPNSKINYRCYRLTTLYRTNLSKFRSQVDNWINRSKVCINLACYNWQSFHLWNTDQSRTQCS